ncbi:MAG: hypothetical protein JWM11_2117, partial [Planctomycetaceae bacterium]|nr:hypothetical protein [Planctomycetaceae bacterium]
MRLRIFLKLRRLSDALVGSVNSVSGD